MPEGGAGGGDGEFLGARGFEYEGDLGRVAVSFIKAEKDSQLFAVGEGRFDRNKIESYAARSGVRENRSGREIFSVPLGDPGHKISFVFLNKNKIALTDAADIARFLAPVADSADMRNWRERLAGVARP